VRSHSAAPVKKKPLKNPEVETSFLPDPEREREEQELREKLKQEWLAEQDRIKGG
jgi:protein FAM50